MALTARNFGWTRNFFGRNLQRMIVGVFMLIMCFAWLCIGLFLTFAGLKHRSRGLTILGTVLLLFFVFSFVDPIRRIQNINRKDVFAQIYHGAPEPAFISNSTTSRRWNRLLILFGNLQRSMTFRSAGTFCIWAIPARQDAHSKASMSPFGRQQRQLWRHEPTRLWLEIFRCPHLTNIIPLRSSSDFLKALLTCFV